MWRRRWSGLGVAAIATALVACASDPYTGYDGPPQTTAPAGPAVNVQALDNNFREKDITIRAGTTVVWTNVGRNDHDVIPSEFEKEPASAAWGVQAAAFMPKAVYSRKFDTPGVYAYVCTIHGVRDKGMAGTITVTD